MTTDIRAWPDRSAPWFARFLVICASLVVAGCGALGSQERAPVVDVLPVELDKDGDGVADAEDLCADSTFLIGIDRDGCSPFNGSIEGVDFPPGGTQLGRRARASLDPLVQALREHQGVRLELQGHTDNQGSASDNLELSKRRVMAVVRYLVTSGVAPDRLDPIAFGESRPIQKNATPEGRRANRRIEIRAVAP